jgi:hypothetical protein
MFSKVVFVTVDGCGPSNGVVKRMATVAKQLVSYGGIVVATPDDLESRVNTAVAKFQIDRGLIEVVTVSDLSVEVREIIKPGRDGPFALRSLEALKYSKNLMPLMPEWVWKVALDTHAFIDPNQACFPEQKDRVAHKLATVFLREILQGDRSVVRLATPVSARTRRERPSTRRRQFVR